MSASSSFCTVDVDSGELSAAVDKLSIVIPCFNEAESLAQLADGMARLTSVLPGKCRVEWLLVDDGSTDDTWTGLNALFEGKSGVRLLRHPVNRGIAAAIKTGIGQASAPVVASLDADCTYDPLTVVQLLTALRDGVDVVVASPYHPAGEVVGVPRWRLWLSRLASRLYRLVLRNRLWTYTSCVRVYRKSVVADLPLTWGGFVGVVELLWQVDRRGGKIVECPAVLRVRTTGQSKMRVARTALAHLRLLVRAALDRWMPEGRRQYTSRDLHLEHCETAL